MSIANLEVVKSRITKACKRACRSPEEIVLVCVTKGVEPSRINEVLGAGIVHIGENRVQESLSKYNSIADTAIWHLVGHLQTNKAKKAVETFSVIQSVDSLHLVAAIDRESGKLSKVQDILVQVKISGEAQKFGVSPDDADSFIGEMLKYPNIRVLGLMGMAPFSEDPESSRPHFRRLREIFASLKGRTLNNIEMRFLSMGMSQDFEVAIEEGANMVRIGSAIFK